MTAAVEPLAAGLRDRERVRRARAGLAAIIERRPEAAAALVPIFDRLDDAFEADDALGRRLEKVRAVARAERI